MKNQYMRFLLLLCICLTLLSCSQADDIWKDVRAIPLDYKNVIHEEDLPFKYDQFTVKSDGSYIFCQINKDKINMYLYDPVQGLKTKNIVEGRGQKDIVVEKIFCDEDNGLILITIMEAPTYDNLDPTESLVLALDMDFQEQWRIDLASEIRDIIIKDNSYFIVSNEQAGTTALDNYLLKFNCTALKVNNEGKVLGTYARENFKLYEAVVQGDKIIISGSRIKDNKREVIIMQGDGLYFFSDYFIVLDNKDIADISYADDNIAILISRKIRKPLFSCDILDIKEMQIEKTINISKVVSDYDVNWIWGVGFLDNKELALLAMPRYGSDLHAEGIDFMLIPIDHKGNAEKMFPLDIGPYPQLFIKKFHQDKECIYLLCESSDIIYEKDPSTIIELQISKDL